ncbi:hypothetical protein EF294_03340 [Gordonia oryzae]|uniref:Exonuclease domain-containing protein n=1 Tax=Gordonia oryzae TaxID=2487349 RepID=A0A3N4HFW8_9ACTN|nr:exonuclease domain-containing protein [Gordonia oryzae]RPA65784.1 hypothetical protein EF294_03340 [Gordonia oryzae]
MKAPLQGDIVVVDVETTGLNPEADQIWEFAAIRRHADGSTTETHIYHQAHSDLVAQMPERFKADYDQRYGVDGHAYSTPAAAAIIHAACDGPGVHLVGANPRFDHEFLSRLLARSGFEAPWDYHVIDVESMALGWLLAKGHRITLPFKSDNLAERCGVRGTFARHTALGDCRWALAWLERIEEQSVVMGA